MMVYPMARVALERLEGVERSWHLAFVWPLPSGFHHLQVEGSIANTPFPYGQVATMILPRSFITLHLMELWKHFLLTLSSGQKRSRSLVRLPSNWLFLARLTRRRILISLREWFILILRGLEIIWGGCTRTGKVAKWVFEHAMLS